MDIAQLTRTLCHNTTGLPPVDPAYCANHGIRDQPNPLSFYVAPELSGDEILRPVCLISAPAAVGKTTLARHIHQALSAYGQGTLYIPLHDADIGSDFFSGRLASVFPSLGKQQFLDAVFSGRVILLFDGYDEVAMRTDQIDRNRQFIHEINTELRNYLRAGHEGRPCILFLFRSVFADFGIFDAFEDNASSLSVRFFDQTRRKRFLTEYLDQKATERAVSSMAHLSSRFLDGFEDVLAPAQEESAAFFGHAVVLSAFGDFLLEQKDVTAIQLAESLRTKQSQSTTAVCLLSEIISHILDREETKFPEKDYKKKLADFDLYSAYVQSTLLEALAEQFTYRRVKEKSDSVELAIDQVVSRLDNSSAFAALTPSDRERIRRDYREELSRRFTHHPFVETSTKYSLAFRNPIYREFFLARRVFRTPSRDWEAVTRANDASHYLALFLLHQIPNRDLAPYEGFLFHFISLLAASSAGDDFLFEFTWDADRWIGKVEASYLEVEPFYFSESILSIRLPLKAALQNVVFNGSDGCDVEIRGPGPEYAYSDPVVLRDCFISASEVILRAAAVRFERAGVVANILEIGDDVARLEGLESLQMQALTEPVVNLKLPTYAQAQWGKALAESGRPAGSGEALFKLKLRQLLLWFRRHGRTEYACYDKKFSTCGLKGRRDEIAVALADFLFERKICSSHAAEPLIVLNQSALADYDIYYGKQNQMEFGQRSIQLLNALRDSEYGIAFR